MDTFVRIPPSSNGHFVPIIYGGALSGITGSGRHAKANPSWKDRVLHLARYPVSTVPDPLTRAG